MILLLLNGANWVVVFMAISMSNRNNYENLNINGVQITNAILTTIYLSAAFLALLATYWGIRFLLSPSAKDFYQSPGRSIDRITKNRTKN